MKKLNLFLASLISLVISVLLISFLALAIPTISTSIPANEKAKEKAAPENPAIDNWQLSPPGLEKIVFIHYKKPAKPGSVCGNNICEPGEKKSCPQDCGANGEESACYKFLKGKAKWQWTEDYYVSTNVDSSAILAGVAEWEKYGGNIFGSQLSGNKPWDVYDNINAITYGDYIDECEILYGYPCAIAVTSIWILGNRIIEYDMIFDSDFQWGNADPFAMDWQNIATHELGHAAGMDDLYETTCSEQTMYGYSTEGETKARTLESGDITGIKKLYS